MIDLALEKMPGAHLYQGDFSQGLVEALQSQSYDFIVATYSLHHLTNNQKVCFLHSLLERLNEDGRILIGDVAFKTRMDLEQCQREVGEEWDDEEIYFVIDEMRRPFPNLIYQPVSYCAGILTLPEKR